jgi:6-phosphogluconolactonase
MSIGTERAFVYVANAESRELLVFRLDLANGALTLVEHVLGGKFTTLCFTPERRFMFAGLRDEPFGIASFAIDPDRGTLTPINEVRMPGPLAFLATDRTGRTLLAASYHNNFVALSAIEPNGELRPPHQIVESIPKAHAVLASPANERVFATSLGDDALISWPFDASAGRLDTHGRIDFKVEAGAGPRHLRFHPSASRLYLLCELDASVHAIDIDTVTWHLRERAVASAAPKGFRGKRWAAELMITPNGKYLYASERTSSTLHTFALNAAGKLDSCGTTATERQPRAFTIDHRGRFLLAVGQKSNRLSIYSIDEDSGALTKLNDYAVGEDPSWVEVVTFAA